MNASRESREVAVFFADDYPGVSGVGEVEADIIATVVSENRPA